jgi:hypothetical protein
VAGPALTATSDVRRNKESIGQVLRLRHGVCDALALLFAGAIETAGIDEATAAVDLATCVKQPSASPDSTAKTRGRDAPCAADRPHHGGQLRSCDVACILHASPLARRIQRAVGLFRLLDLHRSTSFVIRVDLLLSANVTSAYKATIANKDRQEFRLIIFAPLRSFFLLALAVALVGCGVKNSCVEEVANRPGMSCMDLGLGWYHFQYASQAPNYNLPKSQASGDPVVVVNPTTSASRE